MMKQTIFALSAVVVMCIGGMSILSIIWYSNYYGLMHFIGAVFLVGIGLFFLITTLGNNQVRYQKLYISIPVSTIGIIDTIYLINSGAEYFIGYLLVPLFLLLASGPLLLDLKTD